MSEPIQDGKFVELTYKVSDRKSGRTRLTPAWASFPAASMKASFQRAHCRQRAGAK